MATTVKRCIGLLAIWFAATALQAEPSEIPAEMALWRLDCGEILVSDLDQYSDTYRYQGEQKTLANSCYLIRHGEKYLLWDTGLAADLAGSSREDGGDRYSLRRTIIDQLTTIGVRREQITFVGISHYHFDHTGQAAEFPAATLLLGMADWEAVRARADRAARFDPWIRGGAPVQAM
ncbi:MAG: MBL fold metallo-hydrolase, partial [Usitatibacteraceae bacterium]